MQTYQFKYNRGDKVIVLNTHGKITGNGIIENYDINRNIYRVRFLYENAKEEEIIELPPSLIQTHKR